MEVRKTGNALLGSGAIFINSAALRTDKGLGSRDCAEHNRARLELSCENTRRTSVHFCLKAHGDSSQRDGNALFMNVRKHLSVCKGAHSIEGLLFLHAASREVQNVCVCACLPQQQSAQAAPSPCSHACSLQPPTLVTCSVNLTHSHPPHMSPSVGHTSAPFMTIMQTVSADMNPNSFSPIQPKDT